MTETLPYIHLSLVGYNPKFPWKLYKEEINENIRLRKLPSVLLLQVHINTMPLLLLVFCTVTSCYTFRYTVTYHWGQLLPKFGVNDIIRGLVDDPQPMSNMAASAVFTIKIVLKKMVWACVHKILS
jgi:hypothetical protein